MQPSHWRSSCPLALALLALGACGSGPSIRSFEHAEVDLSGYRTYGFHASGATEAQSDFVPNFIRAAISREMRSRGYRDGGDMPDLLVNFHLQTEHKDTVSTSPAAYFGWRSGYHWAANPVRDDEITSYTAGTLNIDVIDRSRNALVWEAVAIGRIKAEALRNPEPAINTVVAQIFQRYPLPAYASANP